SASASASRPASATASSTAAADFRVLLSLCKPVLTRRSTRLLHEAMMLLGGNGIEEEFSPLPRLHRDAVIMETWEGPHNVLYTQALRDLDRLDVDPDAFVDRHAASGTADALAEELAGLLERADDPEATVPFARWAGRMVRSFARRELEEVGAA
ncbi:MAG: acyl-CoA dehydrogenase family protein, partial [Gemmatimonadota bacterium]